MRPNFYAAGRLDRAARLRTDAEWVRGRLSDPATRLVPVWRDHNLIAGGTALSAALVAPEAAGKALDGAITVLLGEFDGIAYFGVDLSAHDDPRAAVRLPEGAEFVSLRQVGAALDGAEAAMLAYAKGLLYWHARHRFCAGCGAETEVINAGHARRCPRCKTQHFPRTDPAVIVLVTHGDRALMGRSHRFPPGMYSTLAGFVEVGESLEDAVAREVFEESGVRVKEVRYHSSQPWPFPASLMLGFTAGAATTEIDFDPEELVDCQWFTRPEAAELEEARKKVMPRSDSIARRLIHQWLTREGAYEGAP
ncbi:MAG: NAD(+) diphosphatase [Proteobacteria bacterium]|nr:NAD(+) diphosphatase [Pseudomonadota bacterium]